MKLKVHIIALLAIVVFIASCVTPLEKSLHNEELPQFHAPITPITIPIQPEYKPVQNVVLNTSLVMDINITFYNGSEKKTRSIYETDISMKSVYNVRKLGEMLTWNVNVIEYSENYDSLRPSVPLADCTILTDKYGNVKESEILLPFFEQPQVRLKMGEAKYEEIKKEMKEAVMFSSTFPNTPVITGSNFTNTNILKYFENSPVFEPLVRIIPEEPKNILKGWAYFNGSKVLVHTTDFVFEKSDENNSVMQIIINGYGLTNPDTFMLVNGESFIKAGFYGFSKKMIEQLFEALQKKDELQNQEFTSADFFIRIRNSYSQKNKNS
ncbi:MAG: hypothetical protein LLG04_18140 [Parachlamydia sp.]|nr:hypothetical protein [Parachlamydia sp.]